MMIGLVGISVLGLLIVRWVLRNVNSWVYERKLSDKIRHDLPPGDLGWPFIGVMRSFLSRASESTDPDSYIATFDKRFGQSGVFKVHMFGNPSIIVTSAEACKKVLTDDEAYTPGWPASAVKLMGRKSFAVINGKEHKWLRKLTSAPVNGFDALTLYMKYIEENVITTLDKWADMGQIELLTELRNLTFKIIMHIFLSSESEHVREALEREYTALNGGFKAIPINIPGFAYYNALKARNNLVNVLQAVVTKRREQKRISGGLGAKKADMMDNLLDAEDENGKRLSDEEIIDLLIMYLNAGHETSSHATMWAAHYLNKNPDMFEKAKAEQEEVLRNRAAGQIGLTLREIRKMDYLNKVIDETLRMVTFSLMLFREAKKDVNVCGYAIPKGWKVLVWLRNIHFDAKTYPDPMKFDPSRWDDFIPKSGNFLPFGGGSRLCPGNDLAKLEISIFLHHFLLNYKFELKNPASPLVYLPYTKPKDNCLGRIRRSST